MFTIKFYEDHSGSYEVFETSGYEVIRQLDGSAHVYFGDPGEIKKYAVCIQIDGMGKAYIVNAVGKTIDTITPQSPVETGLATSSFSKPLLHL